jgi:hypothetical protein
MTTLRQLLCKTPTDLHAVTDHLDALSSDERVEQVRDIPGKLQALLFAAARDYRLLDFEHFVPPEKPERQFVRHFGKNSLPVFSHFEKRFARPEPQPKVLWGFNHGPLMGLIGAGHFVMRTGPERSELHVDYYSIPPERLDEAPTLAANGKGISNLVYGHMIDVLRGVSEHVTIGRAIKHGKETPNYFLLCREG